MEKYIRTLSIPATFFMPGFYMSNVSGGMMHPNPDSSEHEYVLALPVPDHTPIPLFDAADDTGKFVKGILTHRDEVLGKRVLAATDYYTCKEIVDGFREVKKEGGKGSHFAEVSEQEFKDSLGGMPDRGKHEMYENMAFMTDFGYYGKAGLEESHAVCFLFLSLAQLHHAVCHIPYHSTHFLDGANVCLCRFWMRSPRHGKSL